MKTEQLRELMRAKDKKALRVWEKTLAEYDGVYAACNVLGVSKSTAYRIGAVWPAFGKLLEKGKVPIADRVARAGLAAQKQERRDPRVRAKRVRAIKRSARERATQ